MALTIYEYLIRFFFSVLVIALLGTALYKAGLFSPGLKAPNFCRIDAPFGCSDIEVRRDSVSFRFFNGVDRNVNITYMSIPGCSENVNFYMLGASDKVIEISGCSFNKGVDGRIYFEYTHDRRFYIAQSGSFRGYIR